MNETVHIDLTRAETARIVEVIEYIAQHSTNRSVGSIKKKFNLTDAEYDSLMDIAMPTIRAYGVTRAWKNLHLRFLRSVKCRTSPPSDMVLDHRRPDMWADDPAVRLERVTQLADAAYAEMFLEGRTADEVIKDRMLNGGGGRAIA